MDTSPLSAVPEPLRAALVARQFTALTPVQEAVLGADPDRDLRISSQTGSGKTVAFGLALGRALGAAGPSAGQAPRALVMVPTRELAQQVKRELGWLLAPLSLRVLSVTGGTSVWGDLRALEAGCDVVVGTPGRLADHVRSRNVDCTKVQHVILDEADEMLDMGFADELATVLDAVPAERRTHMVSATFPEAVRSLADRYQRVPLLLQGTPLGDPNADIDHLIHVVLRDERVDALINLLLAAPDESTLVFARTREGAAELVRVLREAGFGALLLTGDLDQKERHRTLELFRAGRLRILVATDVAARGLDVPGITRVIHSDPPEDPDAYTHRSGRTGRAGRKGKSHVLIPREARPRVLRLLSHARVNPRFAPIPDPDSILRAAEDRALAILLDEEGAQPDEPTERLARRLLEQVEPAALVARLLTRSIPSLPAEPRTVTPVTLERQPSAPRDVRPRRDHAQEGFVRFQVSWGARHGADPRRVLALLCRRGNITRAAIGAIVVGPLSSFVEVRSEIADTFEVAAQQPDPRDPRVRVRRIASEAPDAPTRTAPYSAPYPAHRPAPGERPNRRPLPPPPAERPPSVPPPRPAPAAPAAEAPEAAPKAPAREAAAPKAPEAASKAPAPEAAAPKAPAPEAAPEAAAPKPPAPRKSGPTKRPPSEAAEAPPAPRKSGPTKRPPSEAADAPRERPASKRPEAPAGPPRKTGFRFKKDAPPTRGTKPPWASGNQKPKRKK